MATAEFAGIKLVGRSQEKVLLLPGNFPDTVWKRKKKDKGKMKLKICIPRQTKFII